MGIVAAKAMSRAHAENIGCQNLRKTDDAIAENCALCGLWVGERWWFGNVNLRTGQRWKKGLLDS